MARTQALVLGGSGTVGCEIVRALRATNLPVHFTFLRSETTAVQLAEQTGACPHRVDLRDPAELRALLAQLNDQGEAPDVLIHAAAISRRASVSELTDEHWEDTFAVNVRSAFVACKALAPTFAARGGDVVLLGALDRGQSLPIPVHFAATQGALGSLTMALAKEFGAHPTRVNLLALGPLEGGLSRELSPKIIEDFIAFSALRRLGTAAEVARVVRWLALENRYLSGKVIPVNGGL